MLSLMELLELNGFDRTAKAKYVRHRDARYDIEGLHRSGWLDTYQAYQSKPVFDKCDRIVSLLATEKTYAKFVGVYSVGERLPGRRGKMPAEFPYMEMGESAWFYELEKVAGFEQLENRVIIDWGKATRRWDQWTSRPKPVIEILRAGATADAIPIFRDYQQFTLTHAELVRVFKDPETHREWRARLTAISGIYLVLDTTSGEQYVGSAYGEQGIWGRWSAYAKNGHGGNKMLRELVQSARRYPSAFQYSILHILPKSLTSDEVLGWESQYKKKLGSRVYGLNLN